MLSLPASVIDDRERVTVVTIPRHELAFVIGAPEFVGTLA